MQTNVFGNRSVQINQVLLMLYIILNIKNIFQNLLNYNVSMHFGFES